MRGYSDQGDGFGFGGGGGGGGDEARRGTVFSSRRRNYGVTVQEGEGRGVLKSKVRDSVGSR